MKLIANLKARKKSFKQDDLTSFEILEQAGMEVVNKDTRGVEYFAKWDLSSNLLRQTSLSKEII